MQCECVCVALSFSFLLYSINAQNKIRLFIFAGETEMSFLDLQSCQTPATLLQKRMKREALNPESNENYSDLFVLPIEMATVDTCIIMLCACVRCSY